MYNFVVLSALFCLQVFFVNGSVLKGYYYEGQELEELNLELTQLENPEFVSYEQWSVVGKIRAANNDQVLKCLVDNSKPFADIITEAQDGTKKCIGEARDKLIPIGKAIMKARDEIHKQVNEMKTVIPKCAKDNQENSTAALECIQDKGIAIQSEMEKNVKIIQASIEEGRKVVLNAKDCVKTVLEAGYEKLKALGASVSQCIENSGSDANQ